MIAQFNFSCLFLCTFLHCHATSFVDRGMEIMAKLKIGTRTVYATHQTHRSPTLQVTLCPVKSGVIADA